MNPFVIYAAIQANRKTIDNMSSEERQKILKEFEALDNFICKIIAIVLAIMLIVSVIGLISS